MPDWYPLFEAAQVLHVPPWELAGFHYESASHTPVCWRDWALDYVQSKAIAQAEWIKQSMG